MLKESDLKRLAKKYSDNPDITQLVYWARRLKTMVNNHENRYMKMDMELRARKSELEHVCVGLSDFRQALLKIIQQPDRALKIAKKALNIPDPS